MVAPDLRGFGDSGLPPTANDAAAHSHDMAALLREALRHVSAVVCAGDLGSVVAQDLSLRYEGLVTRLVLFNTIPPLLPDGPRGGAPRGAHGGRLLHPPVARRRQPRGGARHGGKAAALHRAVLRIRFWAAPGSFTREDVDWLIEPLPI